MRMFLHRIEYARHVCSNFVEDSSAMKTCIGRA